MRVITYIDYQNMYKGARDSFGWGNEKGHFGNFRPLPLSRALAGERELKQIRVYTGVPHPERDRFGHAITQRRVEAFRRSDPERVRVFTRTLKYPPPEGREKGVDVQLAVDVVRLAIEDEFDVLILCSADTDLLPALEFVTQHKPDTIVETVAYAPEPGCEGNTAAPLDVAGASIVRRTIELTQFQKEFADRTNYMLQRVEHPGQSGRRLPPRRHS